MNQSTHHEVDVVILAGGLGTRLRGVLGDVPKVLALVGGRPFLDILLDRLFAQKVGRIILCVGHLKEAVKDHVRDMARKDQRFRCIEFSEEESPLGTGGAIKNAQALIRGEDCIVMNGDTLTDIDVRQLYHFHKKRGGLVTIAAVASNGRDDVGRVVVDDEGKILGFNEKEKTRSSLLNSGTYVMHKKVFSHMPNAPFSLEHDFFPRLVADLSCYAFIAKGDVLDIGTPERYNAANDQSQR